MSQARLSGPVDLYRMRRLATPYYFIQHHTPDAAPDSEACIRRYHYEPLGPYYSTVLYGVTLLQTYQCYKIWPRRQAIPSHPGFTASLFLRHINATKYGREDKRYLLILVGVLTALDTVAVISNVISCYFYLVLNFANPLAILHIDWSLTQLSVISIACIAFLVQCFYAYRAWICTGLLLWTI
ncbi:hypothetical protein K438DRAFT_1969400 [Mycena galopus ATCC 62051]|nr:hypothetical protein K438DRAFT_1969400 [Mycena galopus ATCC 62051]